MTVLLAMVSGMLLLAGPVLLWVGGHPELSPAPSTVLSPTLWTRLGETFRRATTRSLVWRLVMGLVAGVVAFWLTGIPLMLIVGVAGGVLLPVLLGQPSNRDVALLQALDRWVRGLVATMSSGRSIADAMRFSARQAPPLLAPPLSLLVARLDERWTLPQALHAMADELDSPDADAVLAALMLSSQRGGVGGAATLAALADSIQERLRALREIESERAKPRIVVRQVTLVTLTVLGLAMVFGRDFFAPYATSLGQVLLAALLALYVGSLWALRQMTGHRRRARVLRRTEP